MCPAIWRLVVAVSVSVRPVEIGLSKLIMGRDGLWMFRPLRELSLRLRALHEI
jgi:hypothetical protein